MSYAPADPEILWDRPGPFQGVTLNREIGGTVYSERIPHNGLVSQAMAARLLGVSLMAVNGWVRSGKIRHFKITGQPSVIPMTEIKRVRAILAKERRLR